MRAVFFDLETTDTLPCGQILNYCFIATDAQFQVVDECSGDIHVDRLQLPRAGALLANRIRIQKHQENNYPTEQEAMIEILRFLEEQVKASPVRVPLIGFNSTRFDVPYLRTSCIRNGLNPYCQGRIEYCDLFLDARFLAATREDFPRGSKVSADGEPRLSLKLETLCHQFQILEGEQTHHSRDDVLLTIELAKIFRKQFDCDVFKPRSYQLRDEKVGEIYWKKEPEYDLSTDRFFFQKPMYLLALESRSALFVDIEQFQKLVEEGHVEKETLRSSISYINRSNGEFFLAEPQTVEMDKAYWEILKREFAGITTADFFQRSLADIEQTIYRLPIQAIDILWRAIYEDSGEAAKKLKREYPDGWVLYLRHRLKSAERIHFEDEDTLAKMYIKYCEYRYGSADSLRMKIDHTGVTCHPTALQLLDEIDELRQCSNDNSSHIEILEELEEFYAESEVFAALGMVIR